MEITTETTGDVTAVVLATDALDASNAGEFKRLVAPVIQNERKVLFDLDPVQFVDSSGLGAILFCLRQLTSLGGELKLCRLQQPVRVLFELVRMHRIFDIYETPEEAMQAFKPQA